MKYLLLFLSLCVFPCIVLAEQSKNPLLPNNPLELPSSPRELPNQPPELPNNPIDVSMSVFKVTLALGFVLLAIFFSAWLFRRFSSLPTIKNDALSIVGGLSLGNRERIVLLQVGEEQVLLGVTPGRLETLHVLEKPLDTSKSNRVEKEQFSLKLQKAVNQWRKK